MEKDLCLLDVLDHVVRQGADILRIEGQFYTADILAQIVGLYRKYLDRLHDGTDGNTFHIEDADLRLLNQISPRALGYGAYVNTPVAVGRPGEQLPTNELYLSDI
jgi:putative protease